MTTLFVLFEHSAGYGLFRVKEFEEIGMLENEVEKSVLDLSKFKSVIQLVAFMPFKSAANALDNCNSISEGVLHEDLQLFLETNLPKSKKKEKVILGVADSKIGAAIQEALSVSGQASGVVPEIIRGIRLHFHNFVKGFTAVSSSKAQLGLGHSYSRAKVKFNVNRIDNMIIQSISLLDQLDKDINTFSMRIREWYGYHFPELVKIVSDNATYAQLAKYIKNRKDLNDENVEDLENIVMDSAKAQAIIDAAKISMGMDISVVDLINVEQFATRVLALTKYRKRLAEYLKSKMGNIAPNLATLIGDTVGARLISHAGSLTSLAKYPASTVQILGAEKALFRALKTRGNTPKYGLIFHSTFIGRAGAQNKGRISRYLANKCSIASRIDCFSETQSTVFGEKLKEQVEERLKFYETGDLPRKNIDVMKIAIQENAELQEKTKKKKKKKAKKDKSLLENSVKEEDMNATVNSVAEEGSAKKKKKAKKDKSLLENSVKEEDMNATANSVAEEGSAKKKAKKEKRQEQDDSMQLDDTINSVPDENSAKKKKKKSKKDKSFQDLNETENSVVADVSVDETKSKKSKKRKSTDVSVNDDSGNASFLNGTADDHASPAKKSKKKKKSIS